MNMKSCNKIDTVVGSIYITAEDEFIVEISTAKPSYSFKTKTPLLLAAKNQMQEYFANKRTEFDLPLKPKGTEFQQKVWQQLCQIPYGETRSYGQIAAAVGNPKASRAVGMANHNNPIMIVIPCHRVIGANGSLTGYAGGLNIKQALINLEKDKL